MAPSTLRALVNVIKIIVRKPFPTWPHVNRVPWKHCFLNRMPFRCVDLFPSVLQWRGLASANFLRSHVLLSPNFRLAFWSSLLFARSFYFLLFFCSWFFRSQYESSWWNHVSAWKLDWFAISFTRLISLSSLNSASYKVLGHGQNVDKGIFLFVCFFFFCQNIFWPWLVSLFPSKTSQTQQPLLVPILLSILVLQTPTRITHSALCMVLYGFFIPNLQFS